MKQPTEPGTNPPELDGSDAAILARVDWIVKEWKRGCSNVWFEDRGPEYCTECTAGAVNAIKNVIKESENDLG